jgi:hypothetical protein
MAKIGTRTITEAGSRLCTPQACSPWDYDLLPIYGAGNRRAVQSQWKERRRMLFIIIITRKDV